MKIAWPARLRKFQFSLTMLFVLVTLSAVGVDFFRRRADMLQTANWHWLHSIGVSQDAPWEMRVDADYHRRMRIKYKRAAWFPWIPVSEEPSSRDYFHKSADS